MDKNKSDTIIVQGIAVNVIKQGSEDYISLTNMTRHREKNTSDHLIQNWLRNYNTIEFLGLWETLHNPSFKPLEFEGFKNQAGANSFFLTPKRWIEATNAIGIVSKVGRHGGTYAHKYIAFEFATWLSTEFKFYLIHEFDRLKSEEQQRLSLEWSFQRTLAKINYRIHTDAIKEQIVPPAVTRAQANIIYANEADLLNVALFGMTAAEWRGNNPDADGNIRDNATLEQLVVLSNLESINALLIRQRLPQSERLVQLNQTAITQLTSLLANEHIRKLSASDNPKTAHLDCGSSPQ
jgi:hypothetical protein